MMEVFAGFLSHTDHHLGRLLDFLREQGVLDNTIVMVISDNGASAEGGPGGTTNEAQFFNNAQETLEESLAVIDEIGGPEHFNHYPVGLDVGRQHAVPALEARDLPRRLHGPVHRLLARRDQGARRGPPAVRPHHRHGADGPRPPRRRAAGRDPRRHPGADPGRELRPRARRSRRSEPAPHPVLRDARPPGHLQGRLAGGLPVAGPLVRRGRHRVRQPDLGREAHGARRHRLGALPHRRGPGGEPRPRGRAPRQAHRADRDLVRRGRQVRGHAGRRQRPGPDDGREAARRGAAQPVHVRPGHPVHPQLRRAAPAQPPAQHHRLGRDPGGRRRGRPVLPGDGGRRLLALRQGRPAALRPQLRRPAAVHGLLARPAPGRTPRAALRVRADGRASTCRTARAPRDGSSSTSTGRWSRAPMPRTRRRSCSTPAA